MITTDQINAVFPEGEMRELAAELLRQQDELRTKVSQYYVDSLRYSIFRQIANRDPNAGVTSFLRWIAVNVANGETLDRVCDQILAQSSTPARGPLS